MVIFINKENFKKYADIKNKIKALTQDAKLIEAEIKEELVEADVKKVNSDFGTFSVTTRTTWKYTENVDAIKNKLKEEQKAEQDSGVATSTEASSLMFRAKK